MKSLPYLVLSILRYLSAIVLVRVQYIKADID